jgi:hypothetical protein
MGRITRTARGAYSRAKIKFTIGGTAMSLSLKKEKMIAYLEGAKAPGENFRCMLWGTVYAKLSIKNLSAVSKTMLFTAAPGAAGTPNNAFCYIGLTEGGLYVIALDAYNTEKIIGTFTLPLAGITSLKSRKALLGGSHIVEAECGGEYVSLTVKSTSLGTDIKDQKERMEGFLAAIEVLKGSV